MKTHQKYSVIVFDLGNVLINFDYKIAAAKFNEIEPQLGEKFLFYQKQNYNRHREFEKGLLDEDNFIKAVLSDINGKIDSDTFKRIYSDIFTVNYDVVKLLPGLHEKFMLILMSNTDPLHKKYGWEKYNFLSNFDYKVLSFEAGAVKPEEKIYSKVEMLSNVPPERHLYIDDINEYVKAAQNRGWDAIQFIHYDQLMNELKAREIF